MPNPLYVFNLPCLTGGKFIECQIKFPFFFFNMKEIKGSEMTSSGGTHLSVG